MAGAGSISLDLRGLALEGAVDLERSKSISNRVLLIRALCLQPFDMRQLSQAADTRILGRLLFSDSEELDAGDAGTSFRFLTAYLCTRWTAHTLTGSVRMQERPIAPLVAALRSIGARISYLGREGYPPIRIEVNRQFGNPPHVEIEAGVSSQFISALLLVAPTLPAGLEIRLLGEPVSASYLGMTIGVMEYFGIPVLRGVESLQVAPARYQARDIEIEGDWSGASYFYALAALAPSARILLRGLQEKSWQGDSVLPQWMERFGIHTSFGPEGALLVKEKAAEIPFLELDFARQPDLAQTIIPLCAALGIQGLFYGLETLSIKETDRILALRQELAKIGMRFYRAPRSMQHHPGRTYYILDGQPLFPEELSIETYGDHRMAMGFAPWALLHPLSIQDPEVVQKSFPGFWKELQSLAKGGQAL